MFQIDISNYQSIRKVSLKIEGFSVLTGRSNLGKSAIIRAVKSALSNNRGTSYIRHTPECARRRKGKSCKCMTEIRIQYKDMDLLWEKGDGRTRYTLNGKVYDKPEQGFPEFLVPYGFEPITLGTKTRLIQIADQFFPIFLLDESGGVVASILSDAARLEAWQDAIKFADRDRRELVSKRKHIEEELLFHTQYLGSFDGLDEANLRIQSLSVLHDNIEGMVVQSTLLKQLCENLEKHAKGVKNLRDVEKIQSLTLSDVEGAISHVLFLTEKTSLHQILHQEFADLSPCEDLQDLEYSKVKTLGEKVIAVQQFQDQFEPLIKRVRQIFPVESLVVPNTPLQAIYVVIKDMGYFVRELTRLEYGISIIPVEIKDLSLDKLSSALKTYLETSTFVAKLRGFKIWFDSNQLLDTVMRPLEPLETIQASYQKYNQICMAEAKIELLQKQMRRLEEFITEQERIEEELRLESQEYVDVLCPTCGTNLQERLCHG